MRKLLTALLFALSLTPAFSQPPPVPALPDTERRTSFSLTASTCACSVGFAIYGDSTDVDQWISVWINGTKYLSTDPSHGWALTSATGPLATIPRPITNAVLTFNAVQTGTVQVVGAQRPRRLSQFSENRGVSARDLNQVLTGIIAMERERWDNIQSRVIQAPPGETFAILPPAATRASTALGFDGAGALTLLPIGGGGGGSGTVVGPVSSVDGDLALFNGTTGQLLKDTGINIANVLTTSTTITNGTQGNQFDRSAIIIDTYSDVSNVATGFTADQGLYNQFVWAYGDHSSGFAAPNGKTTFSGIKNFAWGPGAGQKLANWTVQLCPGAGDCLGTSVQQIYHGGMGAAGDEGSQGLAASISQPTTAVGQALNSSAVMGGGSTTSTQAITGSYIAQTITVASSAGFTVNEWVNVNQGSDPVAALGGLSEAVQLTAVGAGTLTGAFRLSQPNGVSIKPAVVVTVPYNGNLGQHRFLVNKSTTSYSTGSLASWAPVTPQPVGSGTVWTNTMVGGDAGRPGCIAATADTTISGGIQSWYSIATVSSNTAIVTQPLRGVDLSSSSAAYIIRPCAYILRVIPPRTGSGTATVILENNAFTWTNGNTVEYAIGPGMGSVGVKIDTYTYMPASGVTGYLHEEFGPVAPTTWIKLINFAGTAPFQNLINPSSFIYADTSPVPGGVNLLIDARQVTQFASVTIANGGRYTLGQYGLVQNGLTENVNMAKGVGGQGAGIEHDPIWNHNSVHEGITVDATDTLSGSTSLLFAGKISTVEKWSVRKDGEVTAAGNYKVSAATKTLILKQGANGSVGTFVCTSGGSITVNNTNVAVTDTIIISLNTAGGTITTAPALNAITAATSFVAKCATNDTATYNYAIIKNAAWLLNRDLGPANDNLPVGINQAA